MSASNEDRDALRQHYTPSLIDLVRGSTTATELEIVLAEELEFLLDSQDALDGL